MTDYLAPLPDELLTSWYARRSHKLRARPNAEPQAVQDRSGAWRHPDIQPTRSWLKAAAAKFHVDAAVLAANSLARLRPGVPADFLAWEWAPFSEALGGYRPAPKLAQAWCCRCLAEDFAAGRPAHIRMQWADAASSFCQVHRWPLFDHCPFCRSCQWKLVAPPRGPLRMFCKECWHPLDQAIPDAFAYADGYRNQWDCVAAFEAEVHVALRGRTPDQFRFNFTSASQLINEVRDICGLLLTMSTGHEATNIPLNAYPCAAMRAYGYSRPFGPPVRRFRWRWQPCGCDDPCSGRFAPFSTPRMKQGANYMAPTNHRRSGCSSTRPTTPRLTDFSPSLGDGRVRWHVGSRTSDEKTGRTGLSGSSSGPSGDCVRHLQRLVAQLSRTAASGAAAERAA
ncbi:TniQ family protein [Novosphingobium huizhouense]|uniref:TniQ family protein n=1 Tax=Novosphingobium huizhouense TaxID=2866625 RepID=UPI001CD8D231|nr:TniQ family protein [Novosphingobium huizhouense]